MKVQLVQLLCPSRHCIMATFIDAPAPGAPAHTPEYAEGILRRAMTEMKINPWCGICGSTEIKVELRSTQFEDPGAAAHEIVRLTFDQAMTRLRLDKAGMTYDARMKMDLTKN